MRHGETDKYRPRGKQFTKKEIEMQNIAKKHFKKGIALTLTVQMLIGVAYYYIKGGF